MQQSNALRRLEEILSEAISNGDRNQASGPILLKAMKLDEQPQNIVDFYALLHKAEEEARSIRNKRNIDRYIQTIEKLHKFFVEQHIWIVGWGTFANHIEGDVLNTLDSLADFFYSENPAIFLDKDFLGKLNNEFTSLLEEILNSNLSEDLKSFLKKQIENIQQAIRRYHIDGTEGLEKATKSLVSDLVLQEHSFKNLDKKNPLYLKVKALVLGFLIYITPTPYDIIGAVPDLNDYWIPKFEELVAGNKEIEQIIDNATVQEALKKASEIFDRQPQKLIPGREIKSLSPSKEDSETSTEDKSDP